MKRENMLNHLAHTMPHWPTEYTDIIEPGYGWAWYDEGEDCTLVLCKGEEEIREANYLQRRAELINRPSWDDAPEWAQWLAQDEGGEWFWFEAPVKMEEEEGEWFEKEGEDGRIDRASRGTTPAGHNWRDTLEPRPQAQSDTKTCKHCDITFQRPHLDSVPDDRCMRCHEEIAAKGWDESRADTIGQNGNDGQHYPDTKTWWTHKPCTLCEWQTAAKVSDDRPVCPDCAAADGVEHAEDITTEYDPLEAAMQDQMKLAAEKWERGDMEARSKYHREVKPGVWIDVYDVLQAWGVKNAALQHLIKKALAPGQRGRKDLMTDMDDIVASAKRARELEQ